MPLEDWDDLVGAEFADCSVPVTLCDGVLTVVAASRARAAQLRASRYELLGRIRTTLGEQMVTSLQIVDPTVAMTGEYALLELLQPTMDQIDALDAAGARRIPTGFAEFDLLTSGGLEPGTLTVLAGYPGAGSSTLALGFARAAALRHGIPTAYFTLKASPIAVTQRLRSAEAGIALNSIQTGLISAADRKTLKRCTSEIDHAPLQIRRPPDHDVTVLAEQIIELAEAGTRLIVIDPLDRITDSGERPWEGQEREAAEVTRQLKALALDSDTVIVTTAHLASPRQRTDFRPHLSDIRESGSIAHVADLVVLIHRLSLWTDDQPRGAEVDLIFAEHRHGPTNVEISVEHQLHLCRLIEMRFPHV
ncbi:DciA family protein [Nocardia altamirensis]|uniref:DciA family protein n=1 Tax=Nocardia altamirensis TaxID=472158 RepID=UPI0008404473|nr:DciA family protein [Nocardia altamirensis]